MRCSNGSQSFFTFNRSKEKVRTMNHVTISFYYHYNDSILMKTQDELVLGWISSFQRWDLEEGKIIISYYNLNNIILSLSIQWFTLDLGITGIWKLLLSKDEALKKVRIIFFEASSLVWSNASLDWSSFSYTSES